MHMVTTGQVTVPARIENLEDVYQAEGGELLEPAPEGAEGRVIVTFLTDAKSVNLAERGIDQQQGSDLRTRLASFAEDWQRPEMDVYDALWTR